MSKYDKLFIDICTKYAEMSYARRKKVGAVIVKENTIISDGYNGTPVGFDNICEDDNGKTHWYVLHAEANAIIKMARNNTSCIDSTLYITLSPCKECSKIIIQSGIKRVVYKEKYKDTSGLDFLGNFNVECVQIE
jgi:dCMP deaminase|tara:strand:+ start:10589 stop:10993 length:405 start_codon:yes stop_codon:yes gene_type:complete